MLRKILIVTTLVLTGCMLESTNSYASIKDYLLFQTFTIPQNGMYPGLPPGSQFRCSNYAYSDISKIKYGDIVVFRHKWKEQEFIFVWRVIALPGDRIVTSRHDVYLNQQPLQRSLVKHAQDYDIYREYNKKAEYLIAFSKQKEQKVSEVYLTVPPGQVFLMGDNRNDALDSRVMGTIPFTEIVCGKMK